MSEDLSPIRIKFLSLKREIEPENDNVDIAIYMDDGHIYTALVATPNNIYWCMDNEKLDYFFGIPPILVRKLSQENVETAVRALMKDPKSFNIYCNLNEASC